MCGRFEYKASDEELIEEFEKLFGHLGIAYDLDEDLKTENIAPTDKVKIITFDNKDNVFKLQTMKWGIQSSIFDETRKAKGLDPEIIKPTFNSRIETCTKPGKWQDIFKTSRCLFPMTAFYEWTGEKGSKIAQRISLSENYIFYSGGLIAPGIDNELSASIITCEPNSFMKPVHNRMPVILPTNNAGAYLQANSGVAAGICVPLDNSIKIRIEVAEILAKTTLKPIAKPKEEDNLSLFG
jgi:putative SOS response-associated peptidase YedK